MRGLRRTERTTSRRRVGYARHPSKPRRLVWRKGRLKDRCTTPPPARLLDCPVDVRQTALRWTCLTRDMPPLPRGGVVPTSTTKNGREFRVNDATADGPQRLPRIASTESTRPERRGYYSLRSVLRVLRFSAGRPKFPWGTLNRHGRDSSFIAGNPTSRDGLGMACFVTQELSS